MARDQLGFEPFRIGELWVEPSGNRLKRDDQWIRLEPMVMRVLVYLCRFPGEVVTKEQILISVWENRNVGEEVLTRSISALRKALGDSSKAPRMIETVYKTGYRFLATPTPVDNREPLALANASSVLASVNRKRTGWFFPLGVAILLAIWFLRPKDGVADRGQLVQDSPVNAVLPLTTFPGHEYYSPFSPDSKKIAFVWEGPQGGSNYDIWIKTLGEEVPFQLTQNPGSEDYPAWHPDGEHMAYVRYGEHGGVFMKPLLGGSERRLLDNSLGTIEGISFSPDGQFLAFAAADMDGSPSRIFSLSLSNHATRAISSPPLSSIGDFVPKISPDGKSVLFKRVHGGGGDQDLYLLPFSSDEEGEEAKRLTFDRQYVNGYDWRPSGDAFVFASQRAGYSELWEQPLGGETSFQLSGSLLPMLGPECSPNGQMVSFTRKLVEQNVWRMNLDDADPVPQRLIVSSHYDMAPIFSPDDRRIAFVSYRSGFPELWIANADGSNLVQRTYFNGPFLQFPRWSPDGQSLIFDVLHAGTSQIYRIGADRGQAQALTTGKYRETLGSWSPDGTTLYFSSDRSGSWQIWRRPIDAEGPSEQVTENGGYASAFDGDRLYFTKYAQSGLWVWENDRENLLIPELNAEHFASWQIQNGTLYFLRGLRRPQVLARSLESGETKDIAQLRKLGFERRAFCVSSDGRQLIYGQCDRMESDIMLLKKANAQAHFEPNSHP